MSIENQIKRLKDLVPTESSKEYPIGYLKEQLTTIIKDLEDIKLSTKNEMEQNYKYMHFLNDVNSISKSLKEISEAVNVFVNSNLNTNIKKDAREFVYTTNEITKNKPNILTLFNLLK